MPNPTDNKRVKDEHHEHNNAEWGFSDNMSSFVSQVQERFPGIRITSGRRRESEGHHHTGDAVDIGVRRSTDADALRMYDWLVNDEEGLKLMAAHGLGLIDETDPEVLAKTEGSGPHFHIGKDSDYAKITKERLGQFDSYYTYKGREGAKYKKKDDQWLINLGKETNNQYQPINDPTGSRSEALNTQAEYNKITPEKKSSFYSQNLDYDYSTPYTPSGKVSPPKEVEQRVPIKFELVEGTPEFNFIRDAKLEQKKEEIATDKEKQSKARQRLKAKQEEKDRHEKLIMDVISQNKPVERAPTQNNRKSIPERDYQQVELQDQFKLPSLPSFAEIPEFDGGGTVGHSHPHSTPTYSDSLAAYNESQGFRDYWETKDLEYFNRLYAEGKGTIKREVLPKGSSLEYSTHWDHNSGKEVNAWENTLHGVKPHEIGRSTLYNPDGTIVSNSGIPAIVEYPIYKKPTGDQGTLDPKKSINVNLIKQGFASDTKTANDFKKKLWAEVNPDEDYKGTAAQNTKLNSWIFDNEDKLAEFNRKGMPEAQLPDEIYGEHSFRTGNHIVNGVLRSNPEPEFTPLPFKPLTNIETTNTPSIPRTLSGKPENTTKRYNAATGKWIEGTSSGRGIEEVRRDRERWEWAQKNKMADGGTVQELSDSEIQQYRDGGYIVEEFQDGGETGRFLDDNTHIPFIDRIVNQQNYPTRPNKDGSESSHLMAWASDDEGYFAYPTLQYIDGQFLEFKDPKYAQMRGNILRFDSAEEAEAFADGSWKSEYPN